MTIENVFWSTGTGVTLSNNNLTVLVTSHLYTAKANIGRTTGKWYWEITYNSFSSANALFVGIVNDSASLTTYDQSSKNIRGYYSASGIKIPESTPYGEVFNIGDVIGVFLNLDDGELSFYKNGVSQGISHTDIKSMGKVYPAIKSLGTSAQVTITANFGEKKFIYPPANLPSQTMSYNGRYTINGIILLKSNNKTYSLKSEEFLHETKMTSNTTPAPFVASASSVYASTAIFEPFMAFNGTFYGANDCWASANNSPTGWIQIDYGTKKVVNRVRVSSRNVSSQTTAPKDFDILASNDGVNFTSLLEVKNQTSWVALGTKIFDFENTTPFRYYRIKIISNNGGAYSTIGDILFSYSSKISVTQIPSSTIDNFINYGIPLIEYFNLIQYNKNYILQDTVSEDTDGLWKQEINRKPLSIGFNRH